MEALKIPLIVLCLLFLPAFEIKYTLSEFTYCKHHPIRFYGLTKDQFYATGGHVQSHTNTLYIFLSKNYTITIPGYAIGWEYYSRKHGQFFLDVFRPDPSGTGHQLVNKTRIIQTEAGHVVRWLHKYPAKVRYDRQKSNAPHRNTLHSAVSRPFRMSQL
jgi:hypothetical protein